MRKRKGMFDPIIRQYGQEEDDDDYDDDDDEGDVINYYNSK